MDAVLRTTAAPKVTTATTTMKITAAAWIETADGALHARTEEGCNGNRGTMIAMRAVDTAEEAAVDSGIAVGAGAALTATTT
eukprot:856354-Rhodomonas_salina.1